MILTVSGWRDWTDPKFVLNFYRTYLMDFQWQLHVRVGDCPTGVDKVIRDWQEHSAIPVSLTVYYANWSLPNRSGGPIRNGDMLHGRSDRDPFPQVKADKLLAFPQPGVEWWAARSGTGDCIKQASKAGIHLDIPGYFVSKEERA